MLLFRHLPRTLLLFGLFLGAFSLWAAPAFAQDVAPTVPSFQGGKGKKGDPPPRPKPKPGPRDGGDD